MHPVSLTIVGDRFHQHLREQAEGGNADAAKFFAIATAALDACEAGKMTCLACRRCVAGKIVFAVFCIGGDREPLQSAAICDDCLACPAEPQTVVADAYIARAGEAAAARSGATFHPMTPRDDRLPPPIAMRGGTIMVVNTWKRSVRLWTAPGGPIAALPVGEAMVLAEAEAAEPVTKAVLDWLVSAGRVRIISAAEMREAGLSVTWH